MVMSPVKYENCFWSSFTTKLEDSGSKDGWF